jgi:hypothetical protein
LGLNILSFHERDQKHYLWTEDGGGYESEGEISTSACRGLEQSSRCQSRDRTQIPLKDGGLMRVREKHALADVMDKNGKRQS